MSRLYPRASFAQPQTALRPLALALAGLFAAAQPALAQTELAEAAPTAAASASEAGKLAPVMVTAERRRENAKDVPSAISTISGEKLDVLNSSGEDVRLLSGRTPSLNIESSFGRAFPRFYIRGYGNTDFHLNASQPVSLIYDDVVQENPILKGFPIFDLERVEVLAGPQGTLFGRNTPAGVVKFDSVKPSQTQDGYVSASYGRFGTANVSGAFNLPLSGPWAARLSAQVQHRDDWVTNNAPNSPTHDLEGYDDSALRAQLQYKADKDFTALLNVHARDLKGSARLFRGNIIKPGTNELVDGFDEKTVSFDGANKQTLTSAGSSLKLSWNLAHDLTLHSITGYETVKAFSRGDVDGTAGPYTGFPVTPGASVPFPSETSDELRDHSQISQEVRLESNAAGPLKWQAGAYLFREEFGIDSINYDSTAGGVQSGAAVKTDQTNDAWALFGSVNYELSQQLKLRAGLRYTHDKKSLGTQPDASLNATQGLNADTNDSKTSGDLSATYAITPQANLYARVATGFRASSVQPASAFGPQSSAGPETNTSYEAGVKADLFDQRARASFSVFHYDVKDQQLSAVGGSTNTTTLVSAKKAMGQGVEFNFEAYPVDNLLVGLSGSYNLTKIKDPDLVVAGCAACTVTNPPGTVGGTYRIDGNSLPQAPKWVANVNVRYGIPTASGGEYFVYTDWAYRSKVNFFLYESTEFTGKSLLEGGLRVGYIWGNGKYEAALFGRNITNQTRVTGGIDFNNLTGFINDPRTFGAQFKATF